MIAHDSLAGLFDDAKEHNAEPLWTVMEAMVTPRPAPRAVPALWPYAKMRPLLERAGALVGTAEAERRVFMLVNPALRAPQTTDTVYAGLQWIAPGEVARAHRHTAFALRLIIEGAGGFTAVGGEKVSMERGDLILTPSWAYHDHGHEGDGPMIWLDGLDLPLLHAIPVNFSNPYKAEQYPSTAAPSDSALRYAWPAMRGTLDAAPGDFAHAVYRASDGRHVSRTLGAAAERVAAKASAPQRRETASSVYHVLEGSGETRVGNTTLAWQRGDTFAVPAWAPFVHHNHDAQPAYLFRFDDRPALEALGLYRAAPFVDLRARAPRSARERLGGLLMLARTIDKARAELYDTAGAYKVAPGLSGYLLEWLGIDLAEFRAVVAESATDAEIVAWVHAHTDSALYEDVNHRLEIRGIRDAAHFAEVLPRYPILEIRPELRNWFEILEADDKLAFAGSP